MITDITKLTLNSIPHNQKLTDRGIVFMLGCNGMMWGPYIHLEAGDYVCRFFLSDTHSQSEVMFAYDVCADHGRKILVERSPISRDEQGLYIKLALSEPEDNVEFRLYHAGEEEATITGVHIFRRDNQPMKMLPDTFLIEKSEALFKQASHILTDPENKSFNEVRILQTADANRYAKILAASSVINKAYCQRWGLTYEAFSGIIFGEKPFQAMYNRTSLLWFLMQRDYRGWVLYVDADAAISNFNFDFKSYLLNKRNEGKHFVFHPVYNEEHPSHFFGNINNGVFAVDLSSPVAQALISVWHSLYREYYTDSDYARAEKWLDLLDDQSSLQRILFYHRNLLKPYIAFEPIQASYVFQALRSDHSKESSADDLERRISELNQLAAKLGINI